MESDFHPPVTADSDTESSGRSLPSGDEFARLYRRDRVIQFFRHLPPYLYAGVIVVLVAAGSISLLPLWLAIIHCWATDPLRAIGAAFPLVACAGVVMAWRRLGWTMAGSYWALLLIAVAMPLARIVTVSLLLLGRWMGLMHPGPVLFLYGVGAVLLFGGPRLLRASIAPLCLLLFIDPVPRAFNPLVDMPLQHLAASTARGFAHLIGLHPTGDQITMMFAPRFGMMIVPGCNGVRGSITLGYLALIFGYIRHLRHRKLLLVTLGSFALGYVLNLLRLCILVIYYRIGVWFPALQKHGAGIDYAIGCTLFLFATLCVGVIIRLLEPAHAAQSLRKILPAQVQAFGSSAAMRSLLFVALTLVFIVPAVRSTVVLPAMRPNEQKVIGSFPAAVGAYRLIRTYSEYNNGTFSLAMAEYSTAASPSDTGRTLTLGIWVGSGNHLVARSKYIQGTEPDSTGSFDAVAQSALPVHFVTSFYDDGVSSLYDAESACSNSSCSEHLSSANQVTFMAPAWSDLVFALQTKRLPILLRCEWPDSDPTPSSVLRSQCEADVQAFTAQLNLRQLLLQDGTPSDL